MTPWKVLVVDDEEGIHGITRMIFRGYEFEQRPIELISALNGAQAREQLSQHPDIALVLLDVVMETDNAGLLLVDYIRNELGNQDIRVILRTGHPGYAPEAQVIVNYDINDYLSKAELSASRLLTSVVVALRSYRDIKSARQQACEDGTAPNGDFPLLHASARQLDQQLKPLLKQSKRLQQLDLNPVAKDLCSNLHAEHQRLDNSIQLLQDTQTGELPQPVELVTLLDEILQIFLPQSRRDGWLLDYRLDPALPAQVSLPLITLRQLLISALELTILQAGGEDLKLSLQPAPNTSQALQLTLEQTSGQPVFNHDPWAKHLSNRIGQLAQQLNGTLLDIEEDGAVRCVLPF